MTGHEMHVMFRVLGQQMGLQAVRGILPESINVFLNLAQIEILTSIIKLHVDTVPKGKQSEKDNSVAPTNSLNLLLTETDVTMFVNKSIYSEKDNIYGYHSQIDLADVFMVVGGAVQYENDNKYFVCRLIDPLLLEDTMKDTLTVASHDEPVMAVSLNMPDAILHNKLEVYAGDGVNKVLVRYIRTPDKYEDTVDMECPFPDSVAAEIVKLAVNKFFQSVRATSSTPQQ